MTIAHITDLHVGREGEHPYEVDVRSRFRRIVAALAVEQLDVVVIGGDLCYRDGAEEIYAWIRGELSPLKAPVYVVPGNHDESELLARSFGLEGELKGGKLYYRREVQSRALIFLDTADATLSADQLSFLEKSLAEGRGEPALVFMHHPPVKAGVYYMDLKYPLLNREEVQKSIDGTGCAVFCGHYHVDKTVSIGNLTVYITPSTFVQIDQKAKEFTIDHRRIGWRRIRAEGEKIVTTVHYVEDV